GQRIVIKGSRDAKIKQLGLALPRDQDIGWLEVAMHDQVAMRIGDGRDDIAHKNDTGSRIGRVPLTPFVEAFTIDKLGGEECLTVCIGAAIEQGCNIRMLKPCEDAALALESTRVIPIDAESGDLLDRHLLLGSAKIP